VLPYNFLYQRATNLIGRGYNHTGYTINKYVSLSGVSEVKTASSGGWIAESVVPTTQGEDANVRLTLKNSGNVALSGIRLYDIIPYDTYLGSDGAAKFTGLSDTSGWTVYYYTGSTPPALADVSTISLSGAGWRVSAPGDMSDVTAVMLVYNGTLAAGDSLSATLNFNVDEDDVTVYNKYSFSYTADGSTTTMTSGQHGFSTQVYMLSYDANTTDTSVAGIPVTVTGDYNADKNASGEVILTIPTAKPTCGGYTFTKWSTQAGGGGTSYDPGDTVILTAGNTSQTLYAQWTPLSSYTVTYDENGGTGTAPAGQAASWSNDYKVYISGASGLSKGGYTFKEWNTNRNANATDTSGTVYTVGTQYTFNASTRLYAIWGAALTYNGNNGTGAPTDATVYYAGGSATLSSTEPTRTNYTFMGWSTNQNATTADYVAGGSITLAQNTTLYAVWKADSYTVTYNLDEGTQQSGTWNRYTYGVGLTLPTTPTKAGHTFAGWYDNASFTGTAVTAITATDTGTKEYWAKWTPNSYDITYENLYGASNTNPDAYIYGTGVTSFANPGTRIGYTFNGWYDAATGGNQVTSIGITATGNKTLYARWTANSYDITYNNLNGASNSNPATYSYGVGVTSFANPGSRTGYTFDGWYDAATGGNQVTSIGTTATGNKTLYARWTADSYSISYNVDGNPWLSSLPESSLLPGSSSLPTSYIYGIGVASFGDPGSREGYTFDGWYDTAAGGTKVTSISTTATGDKTLYGVWRANTYNIAYENLNGATNSTNPMSYTYGAGITSFADPGSRTGYTFTGWYDAATSGNKVTDISTTTTGDVTLYAHWTQNLYTITVKVVDTDGKTISGYDWMVNKGYGETFSASAPTIKGYTYQYWKLDGTQKSGDSKIALVEADAMVTLVYQKQSGNKEDPKTDQGNYQFVKVPNVKNVKAGETVNYTFTGFGNSWGIPLEKYTIIDKPDKGLDFVSANLPAFTNGAGVTYDVVYYTNQQGRTVLHSEIPADQAFSFKAPDLASGEYITLLSLEFGTVPAGFAVGDSLAMSFKVWDNPPSQTLVNVGILSYKVNGEYKEFVTTSGSSAISISGYFGAPKTGDETNVMVPLLMLLGSIGILAALPIIQRSRRRKEA